MNGYRDDARTHVGEWADLVGDDVPERALEERTLGGSRPTRRRDGESSDAS